ncbi:hypothetical protein BPAE_0083g00180 [Botrytis paeoniae]|uniref:Uncharacterized protein n=1 Tax=Botrytis paeoniae TaxID=278948 RepID=A0A4Z1FLC7_9HELO|nr:hypothetical protein BPAE_0083g00180 [Botrytis paeoniae]
MANLRTNSNKRARINAQEQDDVNDNVENAMTLIRKTLLTRSLDIKRLLEARLKRMSSMSNAAMSRFQQLCDDNAALEKENEDPSKLRTIDSSYQASEKKLRINIQGGREV